MKYQLINTVNERYSPIEQILVNRGIAYKDINHYLNTTDEDILSPMLIDNIKEGVTTLIQHISQKHYIFMQIDSDVDGYASGSHFLNYLYRLFPEYVEHYVYYRVHNGKEHGIIIDTIPENVSLVIAPDSSSNQFEEHRILKEKGIDVLVIDHHEAERVSENAIVINNQLCDYPTKSLCGVGMVYKFCCYIDELAHTSHADDFLDLVALGEIADMVSLKDFETKHLIQKGIKQIRNPYFKGMVEKNSFSLGGDVTPIGIAFYIAPYINAVVRMGTQEEKEVLFDSMLEYKAMNQIPSTKRGCKGKTEYVVSQAVRNCTNVKNRQTKARDEGSAKIENIIKEQNLLDNKILVVQLEKDTVDKNLTGLIANQLMSKYSRPVLLLHRTTRDGIITWQGSGRGYDKSDFNYLKDFLNSSGLVEYAEGHQNAMGTGISDANFEEFIEYSNYELDDFTFSATYQVDFAYESNDFKASDIIEIASLKSIWGKDVDESLIAIKNIKITKDNITLMSRDRNPTIKITLPNKVSLIKFKSSEEEFETLLSDGCVTIDIVGACAINEWNGSISAQVLIKEYEIKENLPYYF